MNNMRLQKLLGVSLMVLVIMTAAAPKHLGKKLITVYSPVVAECDSSPNEGAGGTIAVNGKPTGNWFASNALPLGTKIIIPSISGITVWICKDRMNSRYGDENIDLCFADGDKPFDNAQRHDVYIVEVF